MIFVCVLALLLFFHDYFFFVFFLAVLLLPLFSHLVARYVKNRLQVSVHIPVVSIGQENAIPIQFEVNNPTVFPMPGVHLSFYVENQFYPNQEQQDMVLPIRRGKRTYQWEITSIYAGRIRLLGRAFTMQDYLGLWVHRGEWTPESYVSVIPQRSQVVMEVISTALQEGDEQELDTVNSVEDVTQVKELREYRAGDRLQRVHWKLSTKQEELYVKEFEREYNQTLTLLVELRRDSEDVGFLDELITAFYSAACRLLDEDYHFQVQWYDCALGRFQTERVDEEDGLLDVLQQMYMMQSYEDYVAYEQYMSQPHKRQDLAIYFTSPAFSECDLEQRIGTYKERVMMVCL
jgi:uncharacterized protein (DUF58 family)